MIFEFINISDPYTFEAPDLEIAAAVTCVVGGGKCGAVEVGGKTEVPMFIFGGAVEWIEETFGKPLEQFFNDIKTNRGEEYANALDSFLIGKPGDREIFLVAMAAIDDPEKKKEFRLSWHDKKRSSLADWGGFAWAEAEAFRKKNEMNKIIENGKVKK